MPDILAPATDSLPKFLTTWGILICGFSLVGLSWVVARLFDAYFSAKEQTAVLIARTTVQIQLLRGDKQSIESLRTAAISALEKKESIDFVKEKLPRLEEITEKRAEMIESQLVDGAKVQVLHMKITWLKGLLVVSVLIFAATFFAGMRLGLMGYREWRAAERKPNQALEPTTMLGTSAAEQPLVPSMVVAHL